MTRQNKYPNTNTFHYFNANPKNRITGDCWCRAICTALEIPYNQVVMEMAELHCKTGYDASAAKRQKSAEKYLKGNFALTGREYAQYAFDVDYDGKIYQCMLNGYTAFMLNDNGRLDLPDMPDGFTKMDILKIYKSLLNNTIDITEYLNIDDIKLYSKSISKGDYIKKPYVIEIADGVRIGFNVGYLMSIYEILGGNIKFYTGKNPTFTPLRCESENGAAIICPVRINK